MSWDLLARELDRWDALGRRATLWWRDDDACRDSPALQRLLAIAGEHRVPVAVAAIPVEADATLVAAIGRIDPATIVQHGYAHENHAPAGERSAELGSHRSLRVRLDELARGREVLARLFRERFMSVLVPPWNRIAGDTLAGLTSVGVRGVSCFGARASRMPAAELRQVNTHVDLIAWRRGRVFIGADAAIERLVAHLGARRAALADADEPTAGQHVAPADADEPTAGQHVAPADADEPTAGQHVAPADAEEPTGLLTHHLVMTGAAFDFTAELFARTRDHRAAQWIDVRQAFAGDAGNRQ